MDDIRLLELRFLMAAAAAAGNVHHVHTGHTAAARFDLSYELYNDMVQALLLDGYLNAPDLRVQVDYARGDGSRYYPDTLATSSQIHPRSLLEASIRDGGPYQARITFSGLRRIEALRAELQRDRILDPLGVLLDLRYRDPELQRALARQTPPVGAIVLDLDHFKVINDDYGHPAGDAVLVAYMEAVRHAVAHHGVAIRAGGDEVNVITTGLDGAAVSDLCEVIRVRIKGLALEHDGRALPRVTASIGFAVTPPAPRTRGLVDAADRAQQVAKKGGKDRAHDGSEE